MRTQTQGYKDEAIKNAEVKDAVKAISAQELLHQINHSPYLAFEALDQVCRGKVFAVVNQDGKINRFCKTAKGSAKAAQPFTYYDENSCKDVTITRDVVELDATQIVNPLENASIWDTWLNEITSDGDVITLLLSYNAIRYQGAPDEVKVKFGTTVLGSWLAEYTAKRHPEIHTDAEQWIKIETNSDADEATEVDLPSTCSSEIVKSPDTDGAVSTYHEFVDAGAVNHTKQQTKKNGPKRS